MANLKSSKKSIIKSEIKRRYNSSKKSMIRTFINKIKRAISEKNIPQINFLTVQIQKILDQQTKKGLIHKNKAARNKSRIYSYIKRNTKHSPD